MIALWGPSSDPPLMAVWRALQLQGHSAVLIDQRAVLETSAELHVDMSLGGVVRFCNRELDFRTVTALYMRYHDSRKLGTVVVAGEGSRAWQHAIHVDDTLLSWAELTPALVVNRPSAAASNHSKPYQANQARALGFNVPDTLITTDADAVLAFWEQHTTVIYKSISGIRSIVARLTASHRGRLADLAWCPTQFQQYVPGTDYRVHVVGEEVFACAVHSQADDYRYAALQGGTVDVRACAIPDEIALRCRSLATAMGLTVAGVDLRKTPNGDWYCFEVNSSPGFTYYEDATGQPIAAEVARLLSADRTMAS